MKHKFIRISDITDIDTSKISVYDMNNRYIDTEGNMYGLRYNRITRKIDIIKIVRTHEKDAAGYHQKIMRKKISDTESLRSIEGSEEWETEEVSEEEEKEFEPFEFIEKTLELMETHGERLKGIIMNIRNSNVIPKENKTDSNELEDIFRNIEIDGIQNFESAINYHKELINYPRSITYYQAKIDNRGRDIIEALSGDNKKIIKFIYLYEMFHTIRDLYRSLNNMIKKLSTFLESKNLDEIKHVTAHDKQYYHDAQTSIHNTIQDINSLLDRIQLLEKYIYSVENF